MQRLQRSHTRLRRISEACLWLLGGPAIPAAELCDAGQQRRLVVDELADECKQRG